MTTRILSITALILFGLTAAAQTVPPHNTVTATIKDANGHPYSKAFYQIQLIDSAGRAIPGTTRATYQGQPVAPTQFTGNLDTSGTFTVSVVPNNAAGLLPTTTQWQINISAPNNMYLYNDARNWSLQYTTAITADTNLSSQLSALAQPVSYVDVNGPSAFLQPVYGVTPTDPKQLATKGYVDAAVGTGGAVQSGTQYQIPAYTTSLFPQVGPSNVTIDATGNNLSVPGTIQSNSIASSPSTTPVCPNGTAGALTTSGCVVGSGTVSGQASGVIPLAGGAATINAQSHLDDGVTTPNIITASRGVYANVNKVLNITAPPYNAKCDEVTSTASITIDASGVVSGASFAAADNGKTLVAYGTITNDNFSLLAWGTLSVSGATGTISPAPTGSITSTNWKYATLDTVAIQQAFTDAGSTRQVLIPAGTCLTDTISDQGTPIIGQGMLVSQLDGLPAKDVLAGGDGTLNYPTDIKHSDFMVIADKSVDASTRACSKYTCTTVASVTTYPHPSGHTITVFSNRITGTAGGTTAISAAAGGPPAPGPVIFGPGGPTGSCSGQVTNSSTTFTMTCGGFSNEALDYLIGQPITITDGTNTLTTTVAALISNTQLQLTAPWTFTTNATTSGSIGTGHQAPWYIGNCAAAYPHSDASVSAGTNIIRWNWERVQFAVNSSTKTNHHECGVFLQSAPYADTFRDVVFLNTWAGYTEALPAANYAFGTWTPDDEFFDNLTFVSNVLPLVRYNGTARHDGKVSIYNANQAWAMGQFWFQPGGFNFATGSIDSYYHEGFTINSGEQERFSGQITLLDGKNDVGTYTAPREGYWNFLGNSDRVNYPFGAAIHVAGHGNEIRHTGDGNGYVTDTGLDNITNRIANGASVRRYATNRGRPLSNSFDSGFLLSGNSTTPYTSGVDLGVTCPEFNFESVAGFGTPGCTSDTQGGFSTTANGDIVGSYSHMLVANTGWCIGACTSLGTLGPKEFTVGDRLPMVSGLYAVVIARCDAACNQVVTVRNERTNASLASATLSFGTTWTTQRVGPIDLSSALLGDGVKISAAAATGASVTYLDLQFVGYAPPNTDVLAANQAAINSTLNSTLATIEPRTTVAYSAANWSFNGAGVVDATSPVGFSSTVSNATALASASGIVGSTALFSAPQVNPFNDTVMTVVTKSTGNPTDVLNGAILSTDLTLVTTTGATSAYPSNGWLLIDQEIVQYSGSPTVGQTTFTVTRGQIGTVAQAHSNGATVTLIQAGSFSVTCNGNTYAVTAIWEPSWTSTSAQVPLGKCNGFTSTNRINVTNITGMSLKIAVVALTGVPSASVGIPTSVGQVPVAVASGGGFEYAPSTLPYAPLASPAFTTGATFGTHTSTTTATPLKLDLGGTYGSNAAGATGNCKLEIYDDGTSNRYCLGISSGTMEYQVGSGATHTFYVNGTLAATIAPTSINIPTGSTYKINGAQVGTIASGTATMTTAAIAAGVCGTTVTVAATNTATTDAIAYAFNAAVAANPGVLNVIPWVTANNVNFEYCNPTAASVTPTAATLNWRVTR